MTVVEARARLGDFNHEAEVAAHILVRQGSEHLLAEAEFERPLEEYELHKPLAELCRTLGPGAADELWDRYAAACAFYMVDAGRRMYDSGRLYPEIENELGLSVGAGSRWAHRFIDFLDRFGFARFLPSGQEGGTTRYLIESILLHGGMPDDAWDQLWVELILPEVARGRTARDAERVVDLALSAGANVLHLRKTTEDILRNGGDTVLRLVANALRVARLVQQTSVVDMSEDYGLPPAAIARLEKVLEAARVQWPELIFDAHGSYEVFLRCPEQSIPYKLHRQNLEFTYRLHSASDSGEQIAFDEVPAVKHGGRLRVDEIAFRPVPTSAYVMTVEITDLEAAGVVREKRLQWRADATSRMWCFPRDRKGRYVCPPVGTRPRSFNRAIYLVPRGFRLATDDGQVCATTPLSPPWGGWTAMEVEAPRGAALRVVNDIDEVVAEHSIGQSCELTLVDEDECAIGTQVGQGRMPPKVYGKRLPTASVLSLDPLKDLDPDEWACTLEWGPRGSRITLPVPLRLSKNGAELTADPNECLEHFPAFIADGVYRVSGPAGAGQLCRSFSRIPMSRCLPVDLKGSSIVTGLRACYRVHSDIEIPRQQWYSTDGVTVESVGDGSYLVHAPLHESQLTTTVKHDGDAVCVNLSLLGVTFECEGIKDEFLRATLPMAMLSSMAAGYVRMHVPTVARSEMRLVARSEDQEDVVLRCVGTAGRYTEALGMGEFASTIGERAGTLSLELYCGNIVHTETLLTVVPGLGLGAITLDGTSRLVVHSEHTAMLPVSVTLKDMTRPWRDVACGEMMPGENQAEVSPEMSVGIGKYGLWARVCDAWAGPSTGDVSGPPLVVREVRPENEHQDLEASAGPYVRALTTLLLSAQDLVPASRPTPYRQPSLPMLEDDALKTVPAAMSVLHEGSERAAFFGTQLMRLREYRYALAPTVLRMLGQNNPANCSEHVLAAAITLRLPLLAANPMIYAPFEAEEIDGAWNASPVIGILSERMHALSGVTPQPSAAADQWLATRRVSRGNRRSLVHALEVCRGTVISNADRADIRQMTNHANTPTSQAYVAWLRGRTSKQNTETAQWVRDFPARAQQALGALRESYVDVYQAIRNREISDPTKTIAQVPFVSGAIALTAAALAHGVPHASDAAMHLAGTSGTDPTHSRFTQVFLEANQHFHELLSQDLALCHLALEAAGPQTREQTSEL